MSWAPEIPTEIQQEKPVTYNHGYSDEEVLRVKREFTELQVKVTDGYRVTREEFKNIVIPHCRIHRTEEFNLAKLKEKPAKTPKEPKEKVAKQPKVKPLTKKELKEFTTLAQKAVMLKAAGIELSEEDMEKINSYKARMSHVYD